RKFTDYQIGLFNKLVEQLNKDNIRIPLVHAANSMGIINHKHGHFNMVRPGLVLYGLHPARNIKIDLKPVLSLKTKVVFSKEIPKGYGVSYGHDYVTKCATTLVTLPIGYGDGYPRNLSNVASVLINGKRFKICGKVCMDQIMVDVGRTKVKTGDEVVLIGTQNKQKVSTEELAKLSGTIPYEIVCGLGSRIPRVYI
ncbi:MAG: alanine racemase, partial [Candidatus Omnitrophica bacterium]|nr:alanine racemase [Candidatus Omnitrophota bacterium]